MFTLEQNARKFDIKLGEECAARFSDGFYYNGVITEINDLYGKITFMANCIKPSKRLAAPSNVTEWVPLNDIVNLSWGLQNLQSECKFRGDYVDCRVLEQTPKGRIRVYYDSDGFDDDVYYDHVRLLRGPVSFYPSAALVTASVKNIELNFDLDEFCAKENSAIKARLDEVLHTAGDISAVLYGQEVFISGGTLRYGFLNTIREKYASLVKEYEKCYNRRDGIVKALEWY